MDALQDLLDEIQRIQCLVCACRRDGQGDGEVLPTSELLEALRLSPSDGGRVFSSLTSEGLFEPVPDPVHPLPRALRLTDAGRDYLHRWQASLPDERSAAGRVRA